MAYLTTTELQRESTWVFTTWQPIIPDAATFTTWLGTIVTRVASHVEWRVTSAEYTGADALGQAVLKEAELCLAQFYVLMAVAAIADSSDDPDQNPAVGNGGSLRGSASVYKQRFDELMRFWGEAAVTRTGMQYRRPAAAAGVSGAVEAIFPPFEADVAYEEPT